MNLVNIQTDVLIYLDTCMRHTEAHRQEAWVEKKAIKMSLNIHFSFLIYHPRYICFGMARYLVALCDWTR